MSTFYKLAGVKHATELSEKVAPSIIMLLTIKPQSILSLSFNFTRASNHGEFQDFSISDCNKSTHASNLSFFTNRKAELAN